MDRPPCQVLLLTADAAEARRLGSLLDASGFRLDHVAGFDEGVRAMARNAHAVCLVDQARSDDARDGFALLREANAAGCRRPAVLLAAGEGNASLAEALAAGVADFLPRDEVDGPGLERSLRLTVAGHARCGFLHAIVSQLVAVAGRLDERGVIAEIEGSLLQQARLSPDALLGRDAFASYPQAAPALRRALGGEVAPLEWAAYLDGRLRHLEGALLPHPGGALFFLRDVTERRRLESEVLEVSDNEQRRLGQDLHDGLGQQLAGIAYLTEILRQQLAERGAAEAGAAGQIAAFVRQAIGQMRDLARGLCPVELDSGGFVRALGRLGSNAEAMFGVRCEVLDAEDAGSWLPGGRQTATHLYRIAQEAMHNAIRHGRARRVTLSLTREPREGRALGSLRVRDDGAGFDAAPASGPPRRGSDPDGGLGLHMMRYRADVIGGTLAIQPAEGGGTLVRCTFPLASVPGAPLEPAGKVLPAA